MTVERNASYMVGPFIFYLQDDIIWERTSDVRYSSKDFFDAEMLEKEFASFLGDRVLVLREYIYLPKLADRAFVKPQKKYVRENREEIATRFNRVAVVIPYEVLRWQVRIRCVIAGIKSFFNGASAPDVHFKIFNNTEDALIWLRSDKKSTRFGF